MRVIYFAGGNGAMWQFPDNADVHAFIRDMYESNRIVAAACHGTATLLNAKLSDGSYLVEERRVTGFSTAEEQYLGQADVMPLLIQEVFIERGAEYVEAEPWNANVVVDGRLITGQNPPSAEGVGEGNRRGPARPPGVSSAGPVRALFDRGYTWCWGRDQGDVIRTSSSVVS